ncbi:MAG: hypothetical protein JW891_12960 [Candidatus Lokiarchaeota archaeon]|nr:hypothetical protein [Candidatus Lokiarchaeota archaeon]
MIEISDNVFLLNEKESEERGVQVQCPACQHKKIIHLPKNIVKRTGLTTISIPKNTICEHQFQIFLDANLIVRGYQKVDFEVPEGSDTIRFKCQICNAIIKFRTEDENSYLAMQPYEQFLGKQLRSFKVIHYYKNEIHINTVIVEENGIVSDVIKSNSVKLENFESKEKLNLKFFKYSEENKDVVKSHPLYEMLIIFNTSDHWIYDLVCSPLFNTVELTHIIYNRIHDAMRAYIEIPPYLSFSIADKIFHLWIFQSNILCVNLKNERNILWLNPVLSEFLKKSFLQDKLISICPRLLLLSDFFKENEISKEKIPLLKRFLLDDLLYSRIRIKYLDRIDRILNKLMSEFNIDKVFVLAFFFQDKSIVDFTKKLGNYQDFEEFIYMIDFINRRGLLG